MKLYSKEEREIDTLRVLKMLENKRISKEECRQYINVIFNTWEHHPFNRKEIKDIMEKLNEVSGI